MVYYDMMGLDRIGAERLRQINSEGYTAAHDDQHQHGELIRAAECYMAAARVADMTGDGSTIHPPFKWPWKPSEWKPRKGASENLTIAGALLAAELDRVLRKEAGLGGRMSLAEDLVGRDPDERPSIVTDDASTPENLAESFRRAKIRANEDDMIRRAIEAGDD